MLLPPLPVILLLAGFRPRLQFPFQESLPIREDLGREWFRIAPYVFLPKLLDFVNLQMCTKGVGLESKSPPRWENAAAIW